MTESRIKTITNIPISLFMHAIEFSTKYTVYHFDLDLKESKEKVDHDNVVKLHNYSVDFKSHISKNMIDNLVALSLGHFVIECLGKEQDPKSVFESIAHACYIAYYNTLEFFRVNTSKEQDYEFYTKISSSFVDVLKDRYKDFIVLDTIQSDLQSSFVEFFKNRKNNVN